MGKLLYIAFLAGLGVFIVDQNIKTLFVEGYRYHGECISLVLAYNKGVAFSMLSSLDEWLKWIQLFLIVGVGAYFIYEREKRFLLPAGMLLGAGLSNVYDRFIHEGVVDYIYWHCGFDFAIFNFADVVIDIAVVWLLYLHFKIK